MANNGIWIGFCEYAEFLLAGYQRSVASLDVLETRAQLVGSFNQRRVIYLRD